MRSAAVWGLMEATKDTSKTPVNPDCTDVDSSSAKSSMRDWTLIVCYIRSYA
jgi:hypothetical protein